MKILLVHNHYQQSGGEDVVFAAETALLREQGHKVEEYLEDNKRVQGLRQLDTARQAIWSGNTYSKLLEILDRFQPDIAHFHNTFPLVSPSAYYACQKAGVSVVQTLHNYRLLCPGATLFRNGCICKDCLGKKITWPGVLHSCYRNSHSQTSVVTVMLAFHHLLGTWRKKVDIYIALTEFSKKLFIAGGLPEEKIMVKPNFIYPDPGVRKGNGDYVLYVGRLSHEKGVKTLLRAWQGLKKIPLKIVGNGPLMRDVQTFIEKHKLDGVRTVGHCSKEEVFALIKDARFLIFPSECYETFGLTVIEAFACGVPVLAAGIGSLTEIIRDDRNGIIFNPGDPEDLAEKAARLWSRTGETRQMGMGARTEFEGKYTAISNYEKMIEIYETALRSS